MKLTNCHLWRDHLHGVTYGGTEVNIRGKTTRELLHKSLSLDMEYPAITLVHRKVSYALLFAEAYWMITGSNKLKDIEPWCARMREYSDDGKTLSGAYGPKFVKQVDHVVHVLKKDLRSRQAVMTFWERNPMASKDIPCTISMQFLVRENYIHTVVNMRSSDTWLGLPYDIFSFSMMTQFVRLRLGRGLLPGMLHLNFASSHIYLTDLVKVHEFLEAPIVIEQYKDMGLYDLKHPDELRDYLKFNRDHPRNFLDIP
jgi:thymidylate synthase